MKRMLKPHLMQTRADDRWHCIWELTESGNSLAYVESPDLLQWKAQKYFDRSRLAEYRPAEVYPNDAEGGSAERYRTAGLDAACTVCHGAACHLLCRA